MTIAILGQTWRPIVGVAVIVIVLGVVGYLALMLYRGFIARAERAEMRAYEDVDWSPHEAPGFVAVVFHTYNGLLAWVTQREHRFWAPPEDARRLLGRLHHFNLTWGFFAYGAALIPLLSWGNYWTQKRSITKQAAALSKQT